MTNVSVMRAEKATETPAAEFHARVDALLPLIENRAAEAENLGRLTDDVVDALRARRVGEAEERGESGVGQSDGLGGVGNRHPSLEG